MYASCVKPASLSLGYSSTGDERTGAKAQQLLSHPEGWHKKRSLWSRAGWPGGQKGREVLASVARLIGALSHNDKVAG